MNKTVISFALIINMLSFSTISVKSQANTEIKKIELIIQLTKFIDWSGKNEILNSKQLLYVLSNKEDLLPNYELSSKRNFIYKNWQIVCIETIKDIEEGSVVFVTKNTNAATYELIKLSNNKNILTIAEENKNFCSKGGMINITKRNNGHNFEINYKIIQQKSLNISSKVLALAKIYDE